MRYCETCGEHVSKYDEPKCREKKHVILREYPLLNYVESPHLFKNDQPLFWDAWHLKCCVSGAESRS